MPTTPLQARSITKGRDRVKGVGVRLYIHTGADVNALAAQAQAVGVKLDSGTGDLGWGPIGFTLAAACGSESTPR